MRRLPLPGNVWKVVIPLTVHGVAENIPSKWKKDEQIAEIWHSALSWKLERVASQTSSLGFLSFFFSPFHGNILNRMLEIRNLPGLSNACILQNQHPLPGSTYSLVQKGLDVPFLRTKDLSRLSQSGTQLPLWLS